MAIHINRDLAQQIVHTVKDVCGRDVNFIDRSGIIFASTQAARIGTYHEIGRQVAQTGTTIEVEAQDFFAGTQYGINMPVYHNQALVAVIGITGPPDEVRKYAHLAERITLLLIRERELSVLSHTQADKRQYVIDTLVRQEISNPAYLNHLLLQLGVDLNTPKRLILIRCSAASSSGNYSELEYGIETAFQEMGIVLFSFHYPGEYRGVIEASDWEKQAGALQTFARLHRDKLKAAVGKPSLLYHLDQSYETALIAWKSIAGTDRWFALFDELTLELILSHVDPVSARAFLDKTISPLSDKERAVLLAYFEEDTSLSQTCRRLFIHKNTLQYQLNQIYSRCGLNPRRFQDGVLLYLALALQQRE